MEKELQERLDLIEFRQELLFSNDSFSRLLFEHNVTREQHRNLMDLFQSLREKIDNGERVSSTHYESRISEVIPQEQYNYHFAEFVAKTLHEEGRFEEVFESAYGDSPKFQNYLQEHNQ
ncbi:DUF1878 domain-containing protein [Priestia megaterium]